MKVKNIIFTLLCFLPLTNIYLQVKKPVISFSKLTHDFGQFEESKGPVMFQFEFINLGASPLVVSNVQPSCGCTTPSWSKEPILPGAKGYVTATYNPAGRPGFFNKSITVVHNGEPTTTILYIKGDVIPKKLSIQEIYPVQMGEIRAKNNQVLIGNILSGTKKTEKLELYNSSKFPVELTFFNIPEHINILSDPKTIQPGTEGVIVVTFDASKIQDWGVVFNSCMLHTGNPDKAVNLTITANISEDFSNLTKDQLKNAPKIFVEQPEYNFGKITEGDKVKVSYNIKNLGKSDLIIRKVAPSCGCTTVDLPVNSIKPDQNITIQAIFDSRGRIGETNKTIQLFTNDPEKPRTILWIKGLVN